MRCFLSLKTAVAGIVWLLLTFLGGVTVPMAIAAESEAAALQKLFQAEWEWSLQESPTFASQLGDERFNHRWPDVSLAAIERRHKHQQQVAEKLKQFDSDKLSAIDRLNLRLFTWQIQSELDEFPFGWYLVPLNQREGIQDESSVADGITFNSLKDYEDWIARLNTFPVYMAQTMELMREGIRRKMVQPKVVMKRLPEQIRRQVVTDPTTSLYYKPLLKIPASISAADKTRIQEQAAAAIQTKLVPAYQQFAKFFDDEYFPACYDEVGAWQAPHGQAFYAQRAKLFTTTELTPDEIHEIGLKEVARIRAEMEAIVKQVKFEGSFPQFVAELRTGKQHYFESGEELLTAYMTMCKRIDPQLTKLFRKLPRIPYGLEPIPQHMAPDTTAAYYRPPAADGSRAGTYFVNLYRPEMRPKYEMEALSLHEAVPGHHLQIALATEMENVPDFRKHAGFTAYVEGWALYAESLGGELGCYTDPYSKFGQLTYEMWRAIRLVVDTGMHSKHWTREQAIELFRQNTAKTDLDIINEVDRYISWPGQALAYKIGELKIQALRHQAEKQLGDKFDVREFHDVLLAPGAVPLVVLEEIVQDWLKGKK